MGRAIYNNCLNSTVYYFVVLFLISNFSFVSSKDEISLTTKGKEYGVVFHTLDIELNSGEYGWNFTTTQSTSVWITISTKTKGEVSPTDDLDYISIYIPDYFKMTHFLAIRFRKTSFWEKNKEIGLSIYGKPDEALQSPSSSKTSSNLGYELFSLSLSLTNFFSSNFPVEFNLSPLTLQSRSDHISLISSQITSSKTDQKTWNGKSIANLAREICYIKSSNFFGLFKSQQLIHNQMERYYSIFLYVINTIKYSDQRKELKDRRSMTSADILYFKEGVCSEFSLLTKDLAFFCNLDVVSISGYANSLNSSFISTLLRDNVNKNNVNSLDNIIENITIEGYTKHSWIGIKTGEDKKGKEEWSLSDPTWALSISNNQKKEKEKSPQRNYYFIVSPLELIFSHFPSNSFYQLISPPISEKKWISLPQLEHFYFTYQIRPSSRSCIDHKCDNICGDYFLVDRNVWNKYNNNFQNANGSCLTYLKEISISNFRTNFSLLSPYSLSFSLSFNDVNNNNDNNFNKEEEKEKWKGFWMIRNKYNEKDKEYETFFDISFPPHLMGNRNSNSLSLQFYATSENINNNVNNVMLNSIMDLKIRKNNWEKNNMKEKETEKNCYKYAELSSSFSSSNIYLHQPISYILLANQFYRFDLEMIKLDQCAEIFVQSNDQTKFYLSPTALDKNRMIGVAYFLEGKVTIYCKEKSTSSFVIPLFYFEVFSQNDCKYSTVTPPINIDYAQLLSSNQIKENDQFYNTQIENKLKTQIQNYKIDHEVSSNITSISHPNQLLFLTEKSLIEGIFLTFTTKNPSQFTIKLSPLSSPSLSESFKPFTLISSSNGHLSHQISVRFPLSLQSVSLSRLFPISLSIFRKDIQSDSISYPFLMEYFLYFNHTFIKSKNSSPFPKAYSDYDTKEVQLIAPTNGNLLKNTKYSFDLKCPMAKAVAAIVGEKGKEKWFHFDLANQLDFHFTKEIIIEESFKSGSYFHIAAKYEGESYSYLLDYFVV